jgi:hypothetical protein
LCSGFCNLTKIVWFVPSIDVAKATNNQLLSLCIPNRVITRRFGGFGSYEFKVYLQYEGNEVELKSLFECGFTGKCKNLTGRQSSTLISGSLRFLNFLERLMKQKYHLSIYALSLFIIFTIITLPPANVYAGNLCFWCEKTLSDYKEILKDKNIDLGEKNDEVSSEYKNGIKSLFTFTSILKESKNENEAFGSVHDSWEDIESAVEDLNDDFKNLVKSADDLFRHATEKANSISDNRLKSMSLKKIESSKSLYTEKLIKSRQSLSKLDILNTQVKDKITALEINYTLDTLDNVITSSFSGLDNSVSEIISELKRLEQETDVLIGHM